MKKTTLFSRLFVTLTCTFLMQAAQAAITEGKDYVVISQAQPVETGDKVEVVEAFSFMCPHCYEFEGYLTPWVKSLPADVAVRKLPIGFNRESWDNLAKAYYTLDAMGVESKLHSKVFDAIHAQKIDLTEPSKLADWIGKQGVDQKKFTDTFESFGIQSKMSRGLQLARAYGIQGVPSFVVDGKYRVTASGNYQNLLRVTDEVIALARSQRPKKAAQPLPKPATNASDKKATAN